MIPYRPDAESEILRSARIFRVQIESSQEGAYLPVSPRFQQREVALGLVLTDVLKGDARESLGDRIDIRVVQTENTTSRRSAVPGAYSRLDLSPGGELLAFSSAEGTSAAEALVDPACFFVAPAGEAAPDVAFAAEAGCPELSLTDHLLRLHDRRSSFRFLFSRYLTDRLPEAFDSESDLAAVLQVLGAPELDGAARFVLCDGFVSTLILWSPVEREILRLAVQGLLQVVALPEAEDLRRSLALVWIPNLVGLVGGQERQRAADMLAGASQLGAQATAALGRLEDPGEAAPLLDWLRS